MSCSNVNSTNYTTVSNIPYYLAVAQGLVPNN
jgi:hypothetical protein